MTRRTILLVGLAAMLTLTAGSVWAGLAWANARSSMKAVDCCLDPACPPGCSEACPPDCTGSAAAGTTTSSCCDDPTCPPGCSPDCPPNCLDLKATAKNCCPPCPFCP
jgi:hypothetical protein